MKHWPSALSPNRMMGARFLLIFPIVLLYPMPEWRWLVLVLTTIAAATDWLDGYVARRFSMKTDLGRCLDPIADKLLVVALLCIMLDAHVIPAIPAILILCRELFVSGLREFTESRQITIHVSTLAKWKTALQFISLIVIMLADPAVADLPSLLSIGLWTLWLTALLTVWTGAEYFIKAWPHLQGKAE